MKDKTIALMSFLAMLFMITILFIFISFGGAKMEKCEKGIITGIMVLVTALPILCIWKLPEKSSDDTSVKKIENLKNEVKQNIEMKIIKNTTSRVLKRLKTDNKFYDSLADSIIKEVMKELEMDANKTEIQDNPNEEVPEQ